MEPRTSVRRPVRLSSTGFYRHRSGLYPADPSIFAAGAPRL